jgi:hypothetical protein
LILSLAAHCFGREDIVLPTVYLGEYKYSTDPDCIDNICNPPVLSFLAEEVKVHENYNMTGNEEEDIALIRLPEAVNFTANIMPICLPTDASLKNFNYIGKTLTAAGWGEFDEEPKSGRNSDFSLQGDTVENGTGSDTLLKVDLDGVMNTACNALFGSITDSQLCAGGIEGEDTW